MLDPVHNKGLRLCLGAFRTSVESLYFDGHKPCLGARRAKLSLQYASKTKSLPKHHTHDTLFDNKYMKLSDARPNAIHTFGLHIKQFLTASNIVFSDILCYHLVVSNCDGSRASEERSHRSICLSAVIHGNMRQVPVYTDCSRDGRSVAIEKCYHDRPCSSIPWTWGTYIF